MPETNQPTTKSVREAQRIVGMIRDELNNEDGDLSLTLMMEIAQLVESGMEVSKEGLFLMLTVGSWMYTHDHRTIATHHFKPEVCARCVED